MIGTRSIFLAPRIIFFKEEKLLLLMKSQKTDKKSAYRKNRLVSDDFWTYCPSVQLLRQIHLPNVIQLTPVCLDDCDTLISVPINFVRDSGFFSQKP